MSSLYKLILKTNIKSPSIAFPLVTPIVFVLVFVSGTNDEQLTTSFFKIVSVLLMQSGTFGFGFNMIALKKSVMLKRIGATKITKPQVLMASIFYGWTMLLISLIWTTSFTFILSASGYYQSSADGHTLHLAFDTISNWGYIVLGMIISIIVSYSLGILFVSLAKTDEQFAMMAMFYLFFTMLLAGLLINNEIRQEIPWMVWIGYFNPTVWANDVINFGTNGANTEELWLEIVVPLLFAATAVAISLKTFKWD